MDIILTFLYILFFGGFVFTGFTCIKFLVNKKVYKYLLYTLTVVFASIITFTNIYLLYTEPTKTTNELTKFTYTQKETNQTQERTKTEALNSLISMLKEFNISPSGADLETRFKEFSQDIENPTKYVTEDAMSYLYLTDTMKTDNINITSALSVLALIKMLGNTDFNVVLGNVEEFIYFDELSGTVHIPLDVFTATSTAISVEMVYVNNQWKFAPYTFIQSIQLSDQIQNLTKQGDGNGE